MLNAYQESGSSSSPRYIEHCTFKQWEIWIHSLFCIIFLHCSRDCVRKECKQQYSTICWPFSQRAWWRYQMSLLIIVITIQWFAKSCGPRSAIEAAATGCLANAGLMFGHRLRRWPNNKPALDIDDPWWLCKQCQTALWDVVSMMALEDWDHLV